MSDALFEVSNLNQRIIGLNMFDKKQLTIDQLEDILHASVHGHANSSSTAEGFDPENPTLDKLILTYEEYATSSLPLLTAFKKYPRLYAEDPELRRKWGGLYVLCYLLKEAMHVYVEDVWRYEYKFVPPSNMSFYSLHDIDADADPHKHGIPAKEAITTVLERKLLLGTIQDTATHQYYALYPLLSMSPEALWEHLRSQTSLLAFVKQHCQSVLDNIASDTITWYPVHEAYQDFDFKAWQFAIDSELRCPHCGTRVSVRNISLDNGKLNITVGTLPHVITRQSSQLPICQGNDFTQHIRAPITVLSGDMAFVDWFRHSEYTKNLKPEAEYDTSQWYSINYLLGRFQQMQNYASKNVMFGGVGNEYVAVYQFDGGLVVAGHSSLDSDDEFDYEDDIDALFGLSDESTPTPDIVEITEAEPSGLTRLGNICTDLWGYTVVDTQTISQLTQQPCSFDQEGRLTLLTEDRECTYDTISSNEGYAGGTTLGRATLEPGKYEHYYLHTYGTEEALSYLPKHVADLIRPYQFEVIHGVLLKA